MKIATISDTHRRHEEINVPVDADIVIHAGDATGQGRFDEIESFLTWFGALPNEHKILIPGNHDFGFERDWDTFASMAAKHGVILLYDTFVTIEGLVIWGSPVQPEFHNWAFNRSRTIEDSMSPRAIRDEQPYIGNHWDKIPDNADIVVTHGPAHGILDETYYGNEHVGCEVLIKKLKEVQPLLHVSGHIHEARGVEIHSHGDTPTTYVNASSLDLSYNPWKDETFVFDLDNLKAGVSYGRD